MDRQTGRLGDRETDRHTHIERWTDIHIQADKQTDDRQTNRHIYTDGKTDRQSDKQIDRWKDRQTDRQAGKMNIFDSRKP